LSLPPSPEGGEEKDNKWLMSLVFLSWSRTEYLFVFIVFSLGLRDLFVVYLPPLPFFCPRLPPFFLWLIFAQYFAHAGGF